MSSGIAGTATAGGTAGGAGAAPPPRRPVPLAANRRERPSRRPVWFMRQAGRSLPEYRELRKGTGMLEACLTPELACEITLQPVRRYGVDAAILFSDIVVPLKAAGVGVDIVAGTGPVVEQPVRTRRRRRRPAGAGRRGRRAGGRRGAAAGRASSATPRSSASPARRSPSPPTSSRAARAATTSAPRRSCTPSPTPGTRCARPLADTTLTFLRAQVDAGVDAVQLFDSWAGALSERDYRELVLPALHPRCSQGLADAGVPRIHFGVGTGELLGAMGEAGADVVGVDWRVPLDVAAAPRRARPGAAGQPRPGACCSPGRDVVDREVRRIVAEGARRRGPRVQPRPRRAARDRPGRARPRRRPGARR